MRDHRRGFKPDSARRTTKILVRAIYADISAQRLDSATVRRWGALRATGRPLPVIDSLVAASVLTIGATLVTRSTADFTGIDGLDIVNPWTDQAT